MSCPSSLRSLFVAALLLPLLSGAANEPSNPFDAPVARGPTASVPLFVVRCWQNGRLLFEERDLQLPTDAATGLKLRGTDRQRLPVYVTDTGNATCLVRSQAAGR